MIGHAREQASKQASKATLDQTCSKQTIAVLAEMYRADNMSVWEGVFNIP